MAVDSSLVDWMLDSDPALRWQVERDLVGVPQEVWSATRARVATEGFGARLLAVQDPDGQWAGGAYFPAAVAGQDPGTSEDKGQPWTATTWTLNALREWGLDAAVLTDTGDRLAANSRWEYDDLPYWGGEVDCCINGYTLANGAWLGVDVSELATWFVDHQLADGGWNCEWVEGSTRSSFHSTLNSLRGLLSYETTTGGSDALRTARKAGETYLLERRLLYHLSTGELVGPWATRLIYPFRWVYSAVNALDYFRAAALHDETDRTRGCPRRSTWCGPPARATAPGCNRVITPGGRGSRSMRLPVSRPSGSPSMAPGSSPGGTGPRGVRRGWSASSRGSDRPRG
ncbi:MAG: squalene cyclase [Propionibacteriaceae bacterium]